MAAYVEVTRYLNETAIRAGTDHLEAVLVPAWGSNLISLKWKEGDLKLLRTPATKEEYMEKPFLYGIPILFPPNRIDCGEFTYGETTYRFAINEESNNNHLHGLLYDKPWKLIKAETLGDEVMLQTELISDDFSDIGDQFPHSFKVRMTYVLKGPSLYKEATIINQDSKPFPWGFGYHTTFCFPINPAGSLKQCTLSLPVDKRWKLNERFLPTGELEVVDYGQQLKKGLDLTDRTFDDVFLADIDHEGKSEAVIHDRSANLLLRYQCDEQFKHWVIFNGNGEEGFLCPEPYTWVTNAPNLDVSPSLTGFRILSPGDQVTLTSRIDLSKAD